ncbi:flagellar protein FlgN [Heyndrickxia sp. NPDC080065]|uniref:flagellar protein FlgN n=1 Tax=Heyndrickxia sp. NPDC080065 TaxID=3390568 RepID=UPI003D02AAB8
MSTEALIDTLDKLQKLHEKLYDLAILKTEYIKKGDMEGLQSILKDEQTFVAAIHTMEAKRLEAAKHLLGTEDDSETTLSDCIAAASEKHKDKLTTLQTNLVTSIEKLKNQNELNQMLTYQSLQFVNMTLDILQPIPDTMNYGRPNEQTAQMPSIPLFNSKV